MIDCDLDGPACLADYVPMAMLTTGLIFAVIRLLIGPSTPDRVVALDLTALLSVGIIGWYSVMTNEASLLAGALVVALLAFLGTVAFARYLERKVLR